MLLFIHAQHQSFFRRIEMEFHHIGEFFEKLESRESLKFLVRWG